MEITLCAITDANLVTQHQLWPVPDTLVGDLRYDEGPVAHSRGLHSALCEARLSVDAHRARATSAHHG